jgi:uncharacterized protein
MLDFYAFDLDRTVQSNIPVNVMVKPVNDACNLACSYCYYSNAQQKIKIIDDDTIETFIKQYIDTQNGPNIYFNWHGGEPTLAGLSFYKKVIVLQNRCKGNKVIHNAIQTNGTLLTHDWLSFLKQENWLVGISLDGTQQQHDHYRKRSNQRGSYIHIVKSIVAIQNFGIRFNCLVTINQANVQEPERVYQHLKSLGISHLQFIPLAPTIHSTKPTSWMITGEQYGNFLTRVFNLWFPNDIGLINVQDFESAYATLYRQPATVCTHAIQCGNALAMRNNGDIYVCDHYIMETGKLGSIKQQNLNQLRFSNKALTFGQSKITKLPEQCLLCPVLRQCRGGCPRHRTVSASPSNDCKLNNLCDGYRTFFNHFNRHLALVSTNK